MDTQKHLYELIKTFKTAMLVTASREGTMRARPMAVAEMKPDADAYFATAIDSPKIDEIEANSRVLVTFQSSTQFAMIEGRASVVRDRAFIERLWQSDWKVWFPKGKDDPSLCILKVTGVSAEYWDNSGFKGLKYVFEGLKAVLQGRKPETDAGQHAKVKV